MSTNQVAEHHKAPVPAAVAAAASNATALQQQFIDAVNGTQPADPVVTPPGNPPPAVVEPPAPAPAAPAEPVDWENRYKAMKGRYDAEVPRLKQSNAELVEAVNSLRTAVATLEARTTAPAPDTPPAARTYLTEKEKADFGEEFLTVVDKQARERFEPIIEQQAAKIRELEQKINGVSSQTVNVAQQAMDAKITEMVPNWVEINTQWEHNGFKEWLQLPDPYSGDIRHDMLNKAYARNDAARVAQFFKGFLAEEAAKTPQPADPSRSVPPAQVDLVALAAPGRAKTAAPTAPAEKPFITRAQITQFYSDSVKGLYKGREAEYRANELAIQEAQREGRVR